MPFEFTKEQLNELFQVYGEIVDSHLMQDKQTGKSRGAAFVTYATKADALNAIESLKEYAFLFNLCSQPTRTRRFDAQSI